MQAEVLAIGDELTSGVRLDTNSQWISRELGEIGIPVAFHTTVVDQLGPLTEVFRIAAERADVVVVSGGLGPTADDLTREAVAAMLGRELVLDPLSLIHIEKIFTRRGRPMPERNRVQAMFPAGSLAIPNPEGTAPGIEVEVPRGDRPPCRIYCLPGVPAELYQMWNLSVRPALCVGRAIRVIRHRELKCFGAGESQIESMLPDLIRRGRVPSVGITAHQATITLRITAEAPTEADCLALIEPTARTIYDCLGPLVYGEENDEMQHAVARLLAVRNQTLAVAEVGTAARIARAFGEMAERRDPLMHVFRGGFAAQSEADLAHVLRATLPKSYDAQGSEVDRIAALATAARLAAETEIGLAVGLFPEPTGPTAPPPNFVCAISTCEGVRTAELDFAGHSAIIHSRAMKQVLNLLRLYLLAM